MKNWLIITLLFCGQIAHSTNPISISASNATIQKTSKKNMFQKWFNVDVAKVKKNTTRAILSGLLAAGLFGAAVATSSILLGVLGGIFMFFGFVSALYVVSKTRDDKEAFKEQRNVAFLGAFLCFIPIGLLIYVVATLSIL